MVCLGKMENPEKMEYSCFPDRGARNVMAYPNLHGFVFQKHDDELRNLSADGVFFFFRVFTNITQVALTLVVCSATSSPI
jgi:hypothetical protein